MARLFFSNFSFEDSLAVNRQELPTGIQRLNAELALCWLAVAEPGDWIWTPQAIDDDVPQLIESLGLRDVHAAAQVAHIPAGLQLVPWGLSQDARQFAATCDARCEGPPAAVVRSANSRQCSWELEQELGVGLTGAVRVEDASQLQEVRADFDAGQRWVLKAEFGAAGRNRLLGTGSSLTAAQARWAERRLRGGEALFLEPWVESLEEVGSQWEIPREGPPVCMGLTRLIADRSGQYLGSEFGLDESTIDSWSDAIECARQAAVNLKQRGYFGPLGIDAMRYRDATGKIGLRPLQDINARWTMGRLALGWRRITTSGIWRHGKLDESGEKRIIPTSPRFIGGTPVRHQTWIELLCQ